MADRGFVEASTLHSKHGSLLEASMTHSARVGHLVVNNMKCNQDVVVGSWIVLDLIRHAHIPV